ncbi:hypothetical protein GCM10027299_49320 [Larkinella ripae]
MLQHAFGRYNPDCHLTVLSNGEQLLKALQQTPVLPALVLMDVNMPIMDGFETLAHIRMDATYDSVPVVILTTSSQPADRQKAEQLQANGFATKPSQLEDYNKLMLTFQRDFLASRAEK